MSEGVHVNRKEYVVIFVWLFVLTVLEVLVAKMDIGHTAIGIALVGMAIAKAAMVALFYMHLKHETSILKWSVFGPLSMPAFYALVLVSEAAWRMLS